MKRTIAVALLLTLAVLLPVQAGRLRLATTTSTENSGLLAVLLPPFEARTDLKVDVIAVGTGQALKLGQAGDVDVVLVHARELEDRFVAEGYGVNRRDVMHNDFIIVGPASDPAGVKSLQDAVAALERIAGRQAVFVSRGDNSGTHLMEQSLWQAAGLSPSGRWYREAGQGMGPVLAMASDLSGYTLADRGTYLSMKDRLSLVILAEGDPRLFNPYGIMAVNPDKFPYVNYLAAMQLIAWMTSVEGQKLIGQYRVGGEQLFFPDALSR